MSGPEYPESFQTARPISAIARGTVPLYVDIVREAALGRREIEAFIHATFARAYGADVRHYMPRLMSLRDDSGTPLAALGFRFATNGRLFLEQYLDAPIESRLAAEIHAPLARTGIVEVGNLAVAHAGGARWLIAALTAYLAGGGYRWAVFTAVPGLVNAFRRLGIPLIALAAADVARLPAQERASWGTYYDTAPTVMAASVEQSFNALSAYLNTPPERHSLAPLWARAYAAGQALPTGT